MKQKPHRQLVLQQARASLRKGRYVVPVPSGRKGPVLKDWPQLRLTLDELPKYFKTGYNIGWILGEASGNLGDVDMDCPEAVLLGKTFLPPTERIHGRKGRPASHNWYEVDQVPAPLKFCDVDGECLVEHRTAGQQTLIPPSIHPVNGERLKWETTGDPARVEGPVLCRAVRKIAAGALLVRHWPKRGQRHDTANALAGMLLRADWQVDEVTEFVGAVAQVAGDEQTSSRMGNVISTAKRIAAGGTATGAPTLASIVGEDVVTRLRQFLELGIRDRTTTNLDWPDPMPLSDPLPPVEKFNLELLPSCFRALVEDVSDRMQTPPDYAAVAVVVSLAGCVNRRAAMQPKAIDTSWSVVPNLWGAIIAPPGFMKTPVLNAITRPLNKIEDFWRADYANELDEFESEKEKTELRIRAWREQYKKAVKDRTALPIQPDNTLVQPTQRRLLTTDSTFEKLHEVLSQNPLGLTVVRDELTGWLADLDREGREGERAFYLQAWSGDMPFTMDRIGRGSIHVPAVCISLLGNIQPARLRWYLADAIRGGANDDGLFQRFQLMVWPDPPSSWTRVDRLPNAPAAGVSAVGKSSGGRAGSPAIRTPGTRTLQRMV